ncbi:LamG-like jellyroll fold domain-containing protein [Actinoplanes subtropicus]|uniref:LamG-like jellyroll fold domain-containing protein n=1 Tax=Actinoplanes subtropicus TaxID=543632 RepID=UPI0004C2FD9D|nr:LamG-like jellyroll fold domain-containing protein [Actinoplanes subtropicus]
MTPHLPPRGRPRGPVWAAALTALTTAGALGLSTPAHAETPGPVATPPPAQPPVSTPDTSVAPAGKPGNSNKTDITAAVAKAAKTGSAVAVGALTDEYSTTVANPNGSLTTTYSTSPDRVRQHGKWVPVDPSLVKHADGTYGPKAALASVSFGAGGSTSLVTLKNGADALRFTWRTKLPKPTVSGDTATYAEVLPGVDLRVTASATGYSSIFVVKTARAAARSDVRQLDLGLAGTHVRAAQLPGGGAEATDALSGGKVFQANPALMWDSSPAANAGTPHSLAGAEQPGGHRAQVKVGIGSGKQTLSLDQGLLTAKTTRYPVYVDPDWSAWTGNPSQMKWARISSNGWNVYNSTATSGSYSARIGYDNWPEYGGAGEVARTYYQMNTSGIKGAIVQSAYLYITNRWAASCSNTAAQVYAAGSIAGWDSSHLSWSKQPAKGALQSTVNSEELSCGTSKVHVTPPTFKFTVTGQVNAAAGAKASSTNFLVMAKDEGDKYDWKQLGYKGGARLSVNYSYRPTVDPDNGKQHVFPSVADQGRTLTTTGTPTLSWTASNKFPNGVVRNLMVDYHVLDKNGKLVAYGYGPGSTKYSIHGSSWTVTPKLPDGNYTWMVTAKNQDGLWASAWGPAQKFTVDTSAPTAPNVNSAQFPSRIVGGNFTDKGTFQISNDKTNNVVGYLFSMDGDLANVTYAGNKGTAWATGTAIKATTVYYAKADNATGTGTVVVNGSAGIVFAPATPGPHRLFVKAVDQAGSTSPQTTYEFNAGSSTPTFVYGTALYAGGTAKNTDGTTTTVPAAAVKTSTGAVAIKQGNPAGMYFGDGYQLVLANTGTTGKVAKGDTLTMSFDVPSTGNWDIGANLSVGTADGIWDITLDSGKSTETSLLTGFDGYSTPYPMRTVYRDFGVIKSATGGPLTLAQGVHTLTFTMTGINAKSAGYQSGIDLLRLSPLLTCSINDTKGCLNNKGISTYTGGTTPAITAADADGWGYSLEANDFKSAGWTPGGTVNVDGAAIKLPATFGDGNNDNMLSAGQYVTVPASGVVNKGNALVLVGWSVNGDTKTATGRITYAPGSGCNVASQAYTVDAVPDWAYTPDGDAVLTLTHRNLSDIHQYTGISPRIVAVSVPLTCPGSAIAAISLPVVTNSVSGAVRGYHLLGVGIRPTSAGSDGTRWAGSWAAAQDTAAVQANGASATLTGQTLRIPAHLSIGTGGSTGKVRVRLSNTFGKTPVTFDAASVAQQDTGAAATTAPVRLTFGGSTKVTVPAGTDVVSDAATITVGDHATVLLSLQVDGTVPALSGHAVGRQVVYVSGQDGADDTLNTDGSLFTDAKMDGVPFLSGVDVTTSPADPAGSVVLYGDQTVNSDTASGEGGSRLSDLLATTLSTDDTGTAYPMRVGVLNEGSASWGNTYTLPKVYNSNLPPSARGLADRELLAQTDVRIALVSSGSSDLLTCTDTAANCASAVEAKLVALSTEIQQYAPDDALNYAVDLPTTTRTVKVYVATLPAFTGAHSAVQESARELVNAYILGAGGGAALAGNADGAIDFAAAVSADGTATGATVGADYLSTATDGTTYPSNAYYQALANQFVLDSDSEDGTTGDGTTVVDTTYQVGQWAFGDGSGTTAADTSAAGTGSPDKPAPHPATLTNVTWSAGRNVQRGAATFNGTSGYADTGLPLNTGKSFTVGMWVRLTDKSANRAFFTKTSTSGNASLTVSYSKTDDAWEADMPSAASGDTVTDFQARASTAPLTGVWTHLAVTYDSELQRIDLYVDGAPDGVATDVTPFDDSQGATWIGRGASSWFAGDISDVNVWFRALGADEVEAEADDRDPVQDQGLMGDWQFEEGSNSTTTAVDSTVYGADGTLAGGVTWNGEGHPNPAGDTGGMDDDLGSLHFDGTGSMTAPQRIKTDQSYTIAGWARLAGTTADATVVSQAGTHSSGFELKFTAACTCWQFVLPATDANSPATVVSAAATAATAGAWTHLAAVYDAESGSATLYVNGTAATPAKVAAQQWSATGKFLVGMSWWNGAAAQGFIGDIDDVYAFQQALDPDDVNQLMNDQTLGS